MPVAQKFPSTSSGLIEDVRQNDSMAWGRLVRLYSRLVWYWCRVKAGLSPEDSADVMQEVFVAIQRKMGDFKKEKGSFRGWLRVITTNKILDFVRKKSRQPKATGGSDAAQKMGQFPDAHPELPNEETLSSDDGNCEKAILIRSLLKELESKYDAKTWKAFYQVKMANRSVAEVAKVLGMTEGAVTQATHRIRSRLKKELKKLHEFEDLE